MMSLQTIKAKITEIDGKISAELSRISERQTEIAEEIETLNNEISVIKTELEAARVNRLKRLITQSDLEIKEKALHESLARMQSLKIEQRELSKPNGSVSDVRSMRAVHVRRLQSLRADFAAKHGKAIVEQFKPSETDLEFFKTLALCMVAEGQGLEAIREEFSRIVVDEMLKVLPSKDESSIFIDGMLDSDPAEIEQITQAA